MDIEETIKKNGRLRKTTEHSLCKRCGKPLHSPESIKRGYGKKCYKITLLQEKNEKKKQHEQELIQYKKKIIETDINFFKCEINMIKREIRGLKSTHGTIVKFQDDPIERIKQEEEAKINDPLLSEYRNAFRSVISELKDVLKERREELEASEQELVKINKNEVLS